MQDNAPKPDPRKISSQSDPLPTGNAAADVALDPRLQTRNAVIFAALQTLNYLGAPVIYVGFVQAALCKRLHTSDTIANLPSTVYLAMAWCPIVIVWLIPQARLLKKTLVVNYTAMALATAAFAVLLVMNASAAILVGALLLQSAVLGCCNAVTYTLNWEALRRGTSDRLRGKALGLAYGLGPGFAVVGSLGAQLLLEGKLFGWQLPPRLAIPYPYSYFILFGATAALMGVGAFLSRLYQYPLPKVDAVRESFSTAILGGFRSVFSHKVLLIACGCYLLLYCGNMVQINMSIFTQEAIGRTAEDLAGYQLALRFSFKMVAGLLLGWLLTRTNPKAPLLVTAGLQMAGVIWVLLVPGYWFLLAFGINGAGELFGVYYVNYPVCCSPKSQVRRNVAFLMLFSSLVGLAPVFYGWVSDHWGLRASFWAALILLVFTTALVIIKLPTRPRPRPEDLLPADLTEPT